MISLLILGWIISLGYEDFTQVISNVKKHYLLIAALASLVTYAFMGLSLKEVLRVLGHKISLEAALSIALVSSAANYVVSSAGVSGFALRAHLLKKRNVPFGSSVTASVVITVLLYMVLAALVLQGCVFLIIHSQGGRLELTEGFAGVIILLLICFGFVTAFFNHDFRSIWLRRLFKSLDRVIYYFSGGQIPRESFEKFDAQLSQGIKAIRQKKGELMLSAAYICADWIFTMLVLYMGFKAVGVSVSSGQLVAGFAIGMVTTLIPVLPSGLGAMELAMTAVYSNMGIAWNSALVASLIFRLAYYVLPAFLSVFIYWGLKISEPSVQSEIKKEEKIINDIQT
ncbi:MAG: lysylphosphatidylglycerol synthase transmembrane domain-containing protein [Elusimicrobia bacterium]|nr:lysylphosphatidylglycerol synthase transmembrane domain-containing protein [Elusimicrobiota bacterium]